jgi:signal transduction histidine kinase
MQTFKVFVTIFLFIFFASCNDNKKNDLRNGNDLNDSLSFYLFKINEKQNSQKSLEFYSKKAITAINSKINDSITRNKTLQISISLFRLKQWREFKNSLNVLEQKAIEANDSINLAQAYRYKGNYYKNILVNDSAFIYYVKAEKLFVLLKDDLNLGNILSNKSIVEYNIGDYTGADKSLTKSYKLLSNINEKEKLYNVLIMMGIVANDSKDYEKAIDYYTKALKITRENNLTNDFQEATCLNNIGYVYQNKGLYSKAIQNYKVALKDKSLISNSPDLYGLLLDNLAYSKFKVKDNIGLPEMFYKSLKVREGINDPTLIVLSKIHLSEYFAEKKDTSKAKKYSKDALNLAKSTKITRDILASLKQASNVDHLKASLYSKDYIRISDSIQEVERISKEKFSRIQLETDEIIQEKDVLEDRNRFLLYVFVTTVILASLLFVVRAQRARTRELLFKQNQQKANEEIFNLMMSQQSIIDESRNKEKKRLAQDLHDGVLGRMFGLRLNLDSLNTSTDPDAPQKRQELLNELKTIEQDIREISHDLNREKLVLINNFVSIVHNLLEEQKTSHEATVEYQIDTKIDWDKIGNAIKINLYRILQEGLQNINKYAYAKNIRVDISADTENVYLKIKDDGIGFDVNKKSKGIGMQNMISRTHDCQGIIDISSQKDHGTKIVITVPIETKKPIIVES